MDDAFAALGLDIPGGGFAGGLGGMFPGFGGPTPAPAPAAATAPTPTPAPAPVPTPTPTPAPVAPGSATNTNGLRAGANRAPAATTAAPAGLRAGFFSRPRHLSTSSVD